MNDKTRADDERLKDFRGPDTAKDADPALEPPVADGDEATPPAKAEGDNAGDPPPNKDEAEPAKPRLSPFDQKRAKIAERLAEHRVKYQAGEVDEHGTPTAAADDPPPDDGKPKAEVTDKAPPAAGLSDSKGAADAPKPETMTLVVNGKTVTKTVAEVAALSELSVDEIKADPKRATRYAQLELAKQEGLNEVKQLRRATPAQRQEDDADTRIARPAPNQERKPAGNDDRDQPPAQGDTSSDDLAKLVEDIQIGDPKEVAPKLQKLFKAMAKETTDEAVQEREGDRAISDDQKSSITSLKEWIDEHPEVEGKEIIAVAMARSLDDEYRADLVQALIHEGYTETESKEIVRQADSRQIRTAHQERRIAGNPVVRRIDKAMMDKAYDRVKAEFGVTTIAPNKQQQPQQQGVSRQERKEALPQQPRRASVPPATPPAPEQPLSRRAVVAEMATRTGKKRIPIAR